MFYIFLYSQLTAAHCEGAFAPGNRLLISALSVNDFAETRFVESFVQNEQYNLDEINLGNGRTTIGDISNDIAVILLNQASDEPLTAWSADTNEPSAGDTVRIVGFGRTVGTDQNSASPVLLETTLTVQSNDDCADNLFKPNQMACASNPTSLTCNGDSGSPFFDTTTNEIIGVVSFGPTGCPVGEQATMTRVSNYDSWIRDKICTLSRVPPADCPGESICGDGICTPNAETEENCPADCTTPEPPTPPTFDGRCQVVNENDITLAEGESRFFSIDVQAGGTVACRTQGANGDADIGMVSAVMFSADIPLC